MVRIRISGDELEELVQLQILSRSDWPARFSCNRREIWPTPTLGYSRYEDRRDLAGRFGLLDRAHQLILEEKRNGGRGFFCEHGVFAYIEDVGQKVQLAEFLLTSAPALPVRCSGH
jgi:hypothetical protein